MLAEDSREFLVIGYDIFPVIKTEERGDGSKVEYELFHARVHALTERGKHVTMLFGAPTGVGEAHDVFDSSIASRPPGTVVPERVIPSIPKPFFMWNAEGSPETITGFVAGHGVTYHPKEKRRGRMLPPQLVPWLTAMVKNEDGTHKQVHVRLYKEKPLDRSAKLVDQIQAEWNFLRLAFDTGKDIHFQNVDGVWLLTDQLPSEDHTPASPESLKDLAQHFGAGA